MALRFQCSKCGKRLTLDGAPGDEVACPHCGQTTEIPADARPTAPGVAEPVAAAAPVAEVLPEEDAAEEDEEGEEEETATDTMMSWLALYLPSWGTSVVLHVAVIILTAFAAWQTYKPQESFKYDTAVVTEQKRKTQRRRKKAPAEDDQPSRGKMIPRPHSIVKHMQNPFPDVAANKLEVLSVIGVGGGGKELGGFEGLGTGSGRGSGGFFGAGGDEASKIVYVVDRSGSMTDSIDFVKFELKRSIGELLDDKEFHLIFYSSGPPVEMPTRRLVAATDRNKQMAFEFIDGIVAHGQTDPSVALERAFAVKPELIYLLTDGEFDKAIVGLVQRLNAGQKVTVHTIGFLYDIGEEVLKQISDQNNGSYKFVAEKDLATLVR